MVWDGKRWVQKKVESGTARGDLAYIQNLISQGKHKKAVAEADLFLKNYPGTPACEEAMNLGAQAMMDMGKYWKAYHRFEDQLNAYPNGVFFERALDREYKIGEAFLKGRKRKALKMFWIHAYEEGVDIMMRISTHSPNSEIAQRSLLRVADYYFDKKDYTDAIKVYEDFEEQYPRSRRRPYAMFQTAQCFFLSYKGINWDETPLVDARKKYEVFAMAYPRMAKDKDIPNILRQIREARAHKVYHTGEFYNRTHKRKAAIFYYQKAVNSFGGTDWADMAKLRLEQLGVSNVAEGSAETKGRSKPKVDFGPVRPIERPKEIIAMPDFPTIPDTTDDTAQPKVDKPVKITTKPKPAAPRKIDSLGVTPIEVQADTETPAEPAVKKPDGNATQNQNDELAPIRLEDLKKRMKSGSKNPGGKK